MEVNLVRSVVEQLLGSAVDSMLVWLLAENTFMYCYERLSSVNLSSDMIELGGKKLQKIAYE
ncbi:MAG TPA: hypothetical protein VK136_09975 [Bacillota bacterium]|nr:hypothetical protein [Bacillota bacterium]